MTDMGKRVGKRSVTDPAGEVQHLKTQLAKLRAVTRQSRSDIEVSLRERIKELDCLYTISRLREMYPAGPASKLLQGIVDHLPQSFFYVEHACARITTGDTTYTSRDFRESPWRISGSIIVNGKPVGSVDVFYRQVPPEAMASPFLKEEHPMMAAVAERIGSVLSHMKAEEDLREAHLELQREHQALQDTNIALKTVLTRLEDEKREIRESITSNIQKILMPIIFELELEVVGRQRSYVTLLRQTLQDIASPFLGNVGGANHMELSPAEIAISTMIRNGLSSKEIAQLRCISQATVRRHRENIRRKLGLHHRRVNLVTFLQSSSQKQELPAARRGD